MGQDGVGEARPGGEVGVHGCGGDGVEPGAGGGPGGEGSVGAGDDVEGRAVLWGRGGQLGACWGVQFGVDGDGWEIDERELTSTGYMTIYPPRPHQICPFPALSRPSTSSATARDTSAL